jgi:putative acetyltransferase
MNDPNVVIRPARVEDAPTLCAAERETARTAGRLASRPHELHEKEFARKISDLSGQGSYLVAWRDGAVVGHALLDCVAPLEALAHVRSLTIVVHPGHTGQGIGTALLHALLEWVRGNPNIVRVELRVREGNAAAMRLYRKCGFTEECRFRRRIRLPDATLIDDIGMAWFKQETP